MQREAKPARRQQRPETMSRLALLKMLPDSNHFPFDLEYRLGLRKLCPAPDADGSVGKLKQRRDPSN